MSKQVISVHLSPEHNLTKARQQFIRAVAGFGVEGDAHAGIKIQHIYNQRKNPDQVNTKQIHIISQEMIDELRKNGFDVKAGDMGENMVTRGVDYMQLSEGTVLRIGQDVEIKLTGLRIPCVQLETLGKGMVKATLTKNDNGENVFKDGPMGIIIKGGIIRPNNSVSVKSEPRVFKPLPPI